MRGEPRCPRCGGKVEPPSVWSSAWTCARHGDVEPLQPFAQPGPEVASHVAQRSRVPVWLPWPLPTGWLVTGVGWAGDDRGGAAATVVACSGPNPLGGPADLVVVAEEPTVGLGAAYAGLTEVDAGTTFDGTAPHAQVVVGGHPTALWGLSGEGCADDRAAFVGEAAACWLWVVLHPASAGHLLAERLRLADLRDLGGEVAMVPFGALTPRVRLG